MSRVRAFGMTSVLAMEPKAPGSSWTRWMDSVREVIPPTGRCLIFYPLLSALKPSSCPTPMFTRHNQYHLDPNLPTPGLLILFSRFITPSFLRWCPTPVTLSLP